MRFRQKRWLIQLVAPVLIVASGVLFAEAGGTMAPAAQAVGYVQDATLANAAPLTDTVPITSAPPITIAPPITGVPPITDAKQFMPFIANDHSWLATRMGYGVTTYPISRYPDIRTLHGGWYVDWAVQVEPVQPGGIPHAQVINVHQKLACGDLVNADRAACPYAQPLDYTYSPDQATIEAAARAHPGQLWFIGNEMDRVDWFFCEEFQPNGRDCKPGRLKSAGQNEIVPETYARVYHDLYTIIKTADPSASVASGGVIQATPLRLQYLTIVWDTYKAVYGQDMPVDVWNVHNFVLREQQNGYGAAVPPGLPGNPTAGAYMGNDCTHTDHTAFANQIRAMRQWMKDRGQQEKPLVVNEYGVLYMHTPGVPNNDGGNCRINFNNETLVHDFMLWTFDYFLNTKDCSLGYTADECRLVQRWLWFSLDNLTQDSTGRPVAGFNPHASLFNGSTLQITKAGELFRQFVQANTATLAP